MLDHLSQDGRPESKGALAKRTSPRMRADGIQSLACPLRKACISSNPLMVA